MRRIFKLSVILFLFGATVAMTSPSAATTWAIQNIARVYPASSEKPDLAFDSSGVPNVSYVDRMTGLLYATPSGPSWSVKVVDKYASTGGFIAIDSKGVPHISYSDNYSCLRYATLSGSSWSSELVPYSQIERNGSLVLDAADQPYLVFLERAQYKIMQAVRSKSQWSFEAIAQQTPSYLAAGQLLLDKTGQPHVLFSDGALKYATKTGGTWSVQTIYQGSFPEGYEMALDSQGRPHVAFCAGWNLYYSELVGSAWSTEQLDSSLDGELRTNSLALDSRGEPRICYYDTWNSELMYTARNGSTWQTELVYDEGMNNNLAFRASLVIDANDNPNIAFVCGFERQLKYAVAVPEPCSVLLLTVGFLGLLAYASRRRQG